MKNYLGMIILPLFLISIPVGAVIAVHNKPKSEKVVTISEAADESTTEKPPITEQPQASKTESDPKTATSTPKPSSNTPSAEYYFSEAEKARAQAVELQRCLDVNKQAYSTFQAARTSEGSIKDYRLQNIFKDNRLDNSMRGAIIRYRYEIYNAAINRAHTQYLSSISAANCTPSSPTPPYNYPISQNDPDLMTNYPFLANYPSVVF